MFLPLNNLKAMGQKRPNPKRLPIKIACPRGVFLHISWRWERRTNFQLYGVLHERVREFALQHHALWLRKTGVVKPSWLTTPCWNYLIVDPKTPNSCPNVWLRGLSTCPRTFNPAAGKKSNLAKEEKSTDFKWSYWRVKMLGALIELKYTKLCHLKFAPSLDVSQNLRKATFYWQTKADIEVPMHSFS